jgi:hypothetical protein
VYFLRLLIMLAGLVPLAHAGTPASIAFTFSAKPEWFRSFWRGETPAGYRHKMADAILPLAAVSDSQGKVVTFHDPHLPDQIERDRSPWPFHQHLCQLGATDWLVSFRVADGRPILSPWQGDLFGTRETPSAHWPELYWVSYDCKTGRRATGRPILSPRHEDRFVFETELKREAQAILKPILAPSE